MSHSDERVEVLVVGAGLVGLAATAMLAQQGVAVMAVDRRPSTSIHPKARLVTVRSMEIYRALGVEDEVYAAGEPNRGFQIMDTLAGEAHSWISPPGEVIDEGGLSPAAPYSCDQQRLEPILLRRAQALGARIEFDTVADLVETRDGEVLVDLTEGSGRTRRVAARYLVAADGARSRMRDRLSVRFEGEDVDGESVSTVFRADLEPALRGRRLDSVMCRSAGAFLFARGDERDRSWQLGTYLRPGWAELPSEQLNDHLVEVIRAATGLPELRPSIEDTAKWRTGAYVADRFRVGPAFLIGDAAHVMPPYGGFGGNTGIQDAHNLAWKIAFALRGDVPDSLLDSYHAERRPVDELTVSQALLRSRKTPGEASSPDEIHATRLSLGFRYSSTGGVLYEHAGQPSGFPGTRAPHVLLAEGRSTLDLVDAVGLTIIGSRVGTATLARPGVRVVQLGPEDIAHAQRDRWLATYAAPGLSGLLIRPDGVIGARIPQNGNLTLGGILTTVLRQGTSDEVVR